VSGREIFQLSKQLKVMLFIEFRRLETESVQKNVFRTALAGFFFGECEETVSTAMPAQFFFDKQQVDVEPAPKGFADQAADHFAIGRVKCETEVFEFFRIAVMLVVLADPAADDFSHFVIGFFGGEDEMVCVHKFSFLVGIGRMHPIENILPRHLCHHPD
jgi:hypothetical protein